MTSGGPADWRPGGDIWLLVDSRTVGGVERHIEILAQGLKRRGFSTSVVIYANYGESPWHAQLEASGVPVRFLDGTVPGALGAIRRERPALIHTHGYKAGILGRLGGLLAGVPVVSTFHSGEWPPFPVKLYYLLDNWSSIASHRITVSPMIQKSLPWRSEHIPNYLVPGPRPEARPLPRKVGFVGRLSHEKAPDLFCEMARRSPPDIEWHVWGDGRMRAELEAAYGDVVMFHGIVSDVAPVWEQIGLLVMPSRAEGLPLAALEALARGVPVLASRVGAVPSVVLPGKTGWLIDVGDFEAARSALEAWRDLPLDAALQMRTACWTHVVEHFSEERLLPKIIDVYARAMRHQTGSMAVAKAG